MVCTAVCVVDGLNNFRVGAYSTLPVSTTAIDPASYDANTCSDETGHTVEVELVLQVTCTQPVPTRYLIIQSLDATLERLCLAEVEVYGFGQYATTFVLVTIMLHITHCLSESDHHHHQFIRQ